MAIHFGKISKEQEQDITLDDLRKNPIWIWRDDLSETNPNWARYFPVLMDDPDLTKEMAGKEYLAIILCRVLGRDIKAFATYDWKERYITGIHFWRRRRWWDLWDIKLPRPLTLVAVPKILGEANVPFYVLSKQDIAAPRVGGRIHRFNLQGDAGATLGENLKIIRRKGRKRRATKRAPRRKAGTLKMQGAELGRAKHMSKITLRESLRNPIWVQTYEEDAYDEEYLRPLKNPKDNVTRKFCAAHDLILTCRVDGQDLYACGNYDAENDGLFAVAVWSQGCWRDPDDVEGLKAPLKLIAMPKIFGKKGVRFTLPDLKSDRAKRET